MRERGHTLAHMCSRAHVGARLRISRVGKRMQVHHHRRAIHTQVHANAHGFLFFACVADTDTQVRAVREEARRHVAPPVATSQPGPECHTTARVTPRHQWARGPQPGFLTCVAWPESTALHFTFPFQLYSCAHQRGCNEDARMIPRTGPMNTLRQLRLLTR